jgi:4-hydroxy-2-oxoheptanedioate aldolase
MHQSLRYRLRDVSPVLATFSILPRVEVVEAIALGGFDAVILDLEHGPYGVESLPPLILAARAHAMFPIVRVQRCEPALIGSALDAGAAGVLVPGIGTPDEARIAVNAARFAPQGNRGAHPRVRAASFSGRSAWFAEANEEAAIMLMIEGREGAANAEAIMETPNLDGVFIGPVDLSHSLGVPGQIDHPRVVEKVDGLIAKAQQLSLATAIFTPSPAGAKKWIEKGVKLVALGVDTDFLMSAVRSATAAARG